MDASPPTLESAPTAAPSGTAALLDAIAAHLTNLVNVIEPDGTIRMQYGCVSIAGHDPHARIGRDVLEFVHPEDLPRARDWLARLAAARSGTTIDDIELRRLHADGLWRQIRLRGTNLLGHPAISGLLAEEHDDTERRLAERAAERVRDRLRLAAESMRMGFFEFDVASSRFEVSSECYLMRGLKAPPDRRVLGREVLNAIHPDDRAPARAGLDRAIAGPDDDWDAEYRLPTAGGDWIWTQQRARVLERDGAGRARRVAGLLLDVDRRKRAERGLVESEARYRTIVAMTPGFVHESVRAADGRLLVQWASEGLTRLLGWTVAELNERGGFLAIVDPEQRAEAARRALAVQGGEPVRAEVRLLSKAGEALWFDASLFPLQEPGTGRVVSTMGACYDITTRKQAEELLRSSEERFRIAATALNGVIYERDVASGMISCSSGVSEVLGLDAQAQLKTLGWWLERIHPDDVPKFLAATTCAPGAAAATAEYRVRHADGHYIEMLDRSVIVRDAHGQVIRFVGCAVDISPVRRAERLVREAEMLAHVGSWQLDVRNDVLTFSDEAYSIAGTAPDGTPARLESLFGFIAPESAPTLRTAIERAIASGTGYDLDVEIMHASGQRRWLRTSGRAEVIDGRTVRLYGAFQDIDTLKRGELRLREQGDWLRLAMDAGHLVAWRWNPWDDRLIIEYRSPMFDERIPVAATLEADLETLVEADRETVRRALRATIATGEPADLEVRTYDSDGTLRWLRVRVIRATTERGHVAIGTSYEVTARRTAEDALRASEAMLRSIADSSPDYIAIVDRELRIRFVNRAVRGEPPEHVIGRPATAYAAGDAAELEERLHGVLTTGRPIRFESHAPRPEGGEAVYEHRVGPVLDGARVRGAIIYSTDITERRALEREILEISNREQRRIGSDLHDGLGQELTGIALMLGGLTGSLQRGVAPRQNELRELTALVNAAIEQTRTLARGLSPIALDGGGLVYALRALTARAREMYGLDVRFRSRVGSRVTLDAAATGHLYRIAQEALTNAARHAEPRAVMVQFNVRGRRVALSVSDDGRGFVPAAASGMGLKIMRYRANMLGGELLIGGRPNGRGTRVACVLTQPAPEPGAAAVAERGRA